jgi:hypothetical protein
MKASIFKLLLSLVAVAALLITSCEGPEGPAGDQGPQGPAGSDGADGQGIADCLQCHNESTDLKAKILQYENSMHFMGTSYARGSSSSCAPCHGHEGYVQWAEGGMESVTGHDYATKTACRTCHEIHTTYTYDDYALKNTGAYNLIGDHTGNMAVDMGKGNQCGKCHQTRARGYGLVVDGSGEVEINSSHWGPHHGPQTNMLLGSGGFEVGGEYDSGHPHNGGGVADGCVSCHLGTEQNHTFAAAESSCEGCHGADFAFDGFQEGIYAKLMTLEEHLVNEGLLAVEHEGEMGHPVSGQMTTNNKAGALFNYFLVYEDGSLGVHNPDYIEELLDNSIAVFEQ